MFLEDEYTWRRRRLCQESISKQQLTTKKTEQKEKNSKSSKLMMTNLY